MDDNVDVVVTGSYRDVARTHETGMWTRTDRRIASFVFACAASCTILFTVVTLATRSASWINVFTVAALVSANAVSAWLAARPAARL